MYFIKIYWTIIEIARNVNTWIWYGQATLFKEPSVVEEERCSNGDY